MVVPEDPVADGAMGVEAEVPVLVVVLQAQAVEEGRERALAGQVAVAVRDHAVAVTVHEGVLDRLAVRIIGLLVQEERARGIAHAVLLRVAAGADADAARLDVVVLVDALVTDRQLGELRILEGQVGADHQAGDPVADRVEVQAEFDTLVGHAADVGEQLVGEVGAHRDQHGVQQVLGVLPVQVEVTGNEVLGEAEVHADVGRDGLLPLDVGIVGARGQVEHAAVGTHVVLRGRTGGHLVVGQVGIVGDAALLAGHAPAEAELELVHAPDILEERLLLDVPGQRGGGEQAPAVVRREARGPVVTQGERGEIATLVGVVHAAVERHQEVLLAVAGDAAVEVVLLDVHALGLVDVVVVVVLLAVVVVVEMLIGVTRHHVDAVSAEIVLVVGEELKHVVHVEAVAERVETHLRSHAVVDQAPVARHAARPVVVGAAVGAGAQVELQVFQAVDLVVDHAAERPAQVVRVPQGGHVLHRVGGSAGARDEVVPAAGRVDVVAVVGVIVDGPVGVQEVHRQGRVETRGRAVAGAARVGEGSVDLRHQGDAQVVLQEGRRQGDADRGAVAPGAEGLALVLHVAERDTVREVSLQGRTADAEVVRGALSHAGHEADPVRVGVAHQGFGGGQGAGTVSVKLLHEAAVLAGGHDVFAADIVAQAQGSAVGDARLAAGARLLGRHEDDAGGGAGAVDGGGGSVLEDGEGVDVVRVDGRKAVRVERHAVHHDQRAVGSVQRGDAAHAQRPVGQDEQAGDLALEQLVAAGHGAAVDLFRLDGGHGAGHVALADRTVTDDDHVFQLDLVVRQDHASVGEFSRGGRDDPRLVSQADHRHRGIRPRDDEREVAVHVRRDATALLSLFIQGSADHGHAARIHDDALERLRLR